MVFMRAIAITPAFENVSERVEKLIDTVTYETFVYTSRGLFEKDKLIFTALVGFSDRLVCLSLLF